MATFTKKLSNDSRYSITLSVSEKTITSDDIANNSSRVDYSLTATKSSGSGYYTSNKTNTIKVILDGDEIVNKKVAYDFTGSTPKTITLASGTTTIQHEADGKKTIQCSGYFKDANNSLGSATASGSLTLTTLHKAPEPYIESITELNTALTSLGITNNVFVQNVSKKRFVLNATKYDDTTITQYMIKNGNISSLSNSNTHILNFANHTLALADNKVEILYGTQDSMGGYGTATQYYENPILYTKPTLVASNLKTTRDGQRTGKVKLQANGSYYNGSIGVSPNELTIQPKLYYSIKEGDTYIIQNVPITPTYSSGSWSVNTGIGTDDTSATTPTLQSPLFYFNPDNAYQIEVYCTDNLIEANNNVSGNTTLTITTYTSNVRIGKAIMTKYSTYVNFEKIKIQKEPIITIEEYEKYTGATASGSNGSITYDITKTDYTPIGIIGFYCDGTRASYISIFRSYISSNNAYIEYKNTHPSNALASNDTKIKIYVAYIRS